MPTWLEWVVMSVRCFGAEGGAFVLLVSRWFLFIHISTSASRERLSC